MEAGAVSSRGRTAGASRCWSPRSGRKSRSANAERRGKCRGVALPTPDEAIAVPSPALRNGHMRMTPVPAFLAVRGALCPMSPVGSCVLARTVPGSMHVVPAVRGVPCPPPVLVWPVFCHTWCVARAPCLALGYPGVRGTGRARCVPQGTLCLVCCHPQSPASCLPVCLLSHVPRAMGVRCPMCLLSHALPSPGSRVPGAGTAGAVCACCWACSVL